MLTFILLFHIAVEDSPSVCFTKCALQGLRGFHLLKNIFIVVVHMACLVAIVDCAHVGSATASFND